MEGMFGIAKEWRAQEEVGESGTPHIQGAVRFKLQKDFGAVKLLIPGAHIEVARRWEEAKAYCEKDDTRKPGGKRWSSLTVYKDGLYDPLKDKELFHWQKHLDQRIASYDIGMREIYWYWEAKGNTGKSSYCRHKMITGGLNAIYVYGKTADIAHVLAKKYEEATKPTDMPSVILYDCPRTGKVNYHSLEMIKNGLFMSGKYDSQVITMNPPFIVVFANFPPSDSALSMDRLKVYKIRDADKKARKDKEWNLPFQRFSPPRKIRRTDTESASWLSLHDSVKVSR